MDEFESVVDRIIREAMAAGEFDDLPGKGQPLDLSDADGSDAWAAHHLLKQHGFAPEWIEDRKEIMAAIDGARRSLARSLAWRDAALAHGEGLAVVAAQWEGAQARFREEVERINGRIRTFNLKAPSDRLHLRVLDAAEELRRALEG